MDDTVLWLRAVKSTSPFKTFQMLKRQSREIVSTVFPKVKMEARKMLWYMFHSWPDEGPLNEVEAGYLGSDSDIALVADNIDFLIQFLKEGADIRGFRNDHVSAPEDAQNNFPSLGKVVAVSSEEGFHVWIKKGQENNLGWFCECMFPKK